MKRIGILGLSLAMLLALGACGSTAAPTPSPTATPIITPMITPTLEPTPFIGGSGNAGGTDITPENTTPGATAEPGTTATPGTTPGTAGNTGMTIPNFKEGAAVMTTDIPEIMSAFEEKYKGYEVVGVSYGTQDNNQVYVVNYKDTAGKAGKAYLRHDATWYEPSAATSSDGVN